MPHENEYTHKFLQNCLNDYSCVKNKTLKTKSRLVEVPHLAVMLVWSRTAFFSIQQLQRFESSLLQDADMSVLVMFILNLRMVFFCMTMSCFTNVRKYSRCKSNISACSQFRNTILRIFCWINLPNLMTSSKLAYHKYKFLKKPKSFCQIFDISFSEQWPGKTLILTKKSKNSGPSPTHFTN